MQACFCSGEGGRTVFLQVKTPLFPDCSQLELQRADGVACKAYSRVTIKQDVRGGGKARETNKTEGVSCTYSQP